MKKLLIWVLGFRPSVVIQPARTDVAMVHQFSRDNLRGAQSQLIFGSELVQDGVVRITSTTDVPYTMENLLLFAGGAGYEVILSSETPMKLHMRSEKNEILVRHPDGNMHEYSMIVREPGAEVAYRWVLG